MRKLRVLITGGAGFIGSNLSRRLLSEGVRVVAVDNFITSSPQNINELRRSPDFIFFKHNITEPFAESAQKKIGKLDQIYHLACPTGVGNLTALSEEMLLSSTSGTRNVLELAKRNNAKFLFTSSSEVYGNPKVSPQSESYTGNVDPLGTRGVYEEGKRLSETMIQVYIKKYNLDAKIVRVFNTYGPHMDISDTRVIPHFLSRLRYNQPLPIHGDGEQTRTFCYVDDLIEGLLLVMNKGKKGSVYNLGSDTEVTISRLAQIMIELYQHGGKITSISRPDHDTDSRHPDISKVKKLGWSPKVSLTEGLKQTMVWYGL